MTKRKVEQNAAANVTRNVTSLKGHECDLGCQLFKEGGVPGSVKGWAVAASSSAPAPPPRLLRPGSSAPPAPPRLGGLGPPPALALAAVVALPPSPAPAPPAPTVPALKFHAVYGKYGKYLKMVKTEFLGRIRRGRRRRS